MILKDIRFHGYHGVAEAEREIGQKYELDVELNYDFSTAGQTDNLTHTINYAKVVELIVSIGTERSFQLIEALAETVATAILNQFPIDEVRVTAKKLTPPIEPLLSYAAVEIHRKK